MMTDEEVEDFLAHYGVKGMRWGVRKDRRQARKNARQDKKFDKVGKKGITNLNARADTHKKAWAAYKALDSERIDAKYKGKFWMDTSDPGFKKYMEEHETAFVKRLNEAAASLGTNSAGTKKWGVSRTSLPDPEDLGDGFSGARGGEWEFKLKRVRHDALPDDTIKVRFTLDGNLRIKELELIETQITQEDRTEDFLAHYGVKGMRWGVRKDRKTGSSGSGARKKLKSAKTTASKASTSARKKLRGVRMKDIKQMSDQELQAKLRRLNMERQYQSLSGNKPAVKAGYEFTRNIAKTAVAGALTAAATKQVAAALNVVLKNKK